MRSLTLPPLFAAAVLLSLSRESQACRVRLRSTASAAYDLDSCSVSATARSTIDTSRTVMIWLVSMAIGWEQFKWIQVVGFSLLVYGTLCVALLLLHFVPSRLEHSHPSHSVFNGITTFPDWTGLHKESIPSIVLPDEPTSEDEDEDEEDNIGRSRSVDNMGRPVTRRSGSGRRGEISPLLKNIDQR